MQRFREGNISTADTGIGDESGRTGSRTRVNKYTLISRGIFFTGMMDLIFSADYLNENNRNNNSCHI